MDLKALSKELEIKASTLVEGIRIDPPALEGVGTRFYPEEAPAGKVSQ